MTERSSSFSASGVSTWGIVTVVIIGLAVKAAPFRR